MMIRSEYHDNISVATIHDDNGLGRGGQKSIFDRLSWIDGLKKICMPKVSAGFAVAQQEGARSWLFLKKDRFYQYSVLANWYNFTAGPVFHGAKHEATKLTLLAAMSDQLRRKAHRIIISPVADEDELATLTVRAFRQAGWIVIRTQCDENHILRLGNLSFDEYWKKRPGQLRSTVKRKSKKNDVAIRIDTEFSAESWQDYLTVYRRSWKPEEGNPDFLEMIARQESAAGCLRLGLAYIEGKPVAAQLWTVENGEALIHKLAHDERALKSSPGTLLSAALFQHVIDCDKISLIDFGTGSDAYKADWMDEVRMRYRLEMLWPHNPLSWPYIIRHWISGLVPRRTNG